MLAQINWRLACFLFYPFILLISEAELLFLCFSPVMIWFWVFFFLSVKKEQVKIQPPVHPQRKLRQDQKGMPGKYIILPVGNTAVTWVVFLMVSWAAWKNSVWLCFGQGGSKQLMPTCCHVLGRSDCTVTSFYVQWFLSSC